MNTVIRSLGCVALVAAFFAANAQEEEEIVENDATATAGSGAKTREATPDKPFYTLPLCRVLEGRGEVKKPGSADFEALEEGRFYPLGSSYRTIGPNSRLTIALGESASVEIVGEASFATRPQPLAVKNRTLVLQNGTIDVKLPRDFKEDLMVVSAPGFTVERLRGDSRFFYEKTGDGDNAVVRCITGSFAINGRHFKIPAMRAANELKIRTSTDLLYTGLFGTSGDYSIVLDQGLIQQRDYETQKDKIEARTLNWQMSPLSSVRIHRSKPALGEKLAVCVMTFDAQGNLKNRCAFTEGRHEINSGELVAITLSDAEALKKKAAEAAETSTEEADDEEEEESSESESSGEESSDSEESDSDSEEDF